MSYHVFYNSEDEYLAHSLKGLARKIHKYLLRIKTSKGYRYFYSKAEIDAYMKKLKGKDHSDASESEEQKKSNNKNARIRELLKEQKERESQGYHSKREQEEAEREKLLKANRSQAERIDDAEKKVSEVARLIGDDSSVDKAKWDFKAGKITADDYEAALSKYIIDNYKSKNLHPNGQERDKKNQEVAKKAVAVSKKKLNEIATEREHEVAFKNYAYVGNVQNAIQSKARTYSAPTRTKVNDETKARANVVAKAQKQMDELQKKIKDGSISSGMAALSARAIQDEMEFSLDDIDYEVKRNNGANLKQYLN